MAFRIRPAIPVLSNGTYPAMIKDVIEQDSNFPGGKPRLKWTFAITTAATPDYEYEILAWTNVDFFHGSPEHTWASAALGRTLDPQDTLEETDLIGAPVRLKITPKPGKTVGTVLYNVDAVLPPTSGDESEAGMVGTPAATDEDVPFDRF